LRPNTSHAHFIANILVKDKKSSLKIEQALENFSCKAIHLIPFFILLYGNVVFFNKTINGSKETTNSII
jgi:hypothetical protein